MNQRQHKILEAAIAVFSRYGVRKATMGDIAEMVGISRQTLYANYANKNDILTAAIRHLGDQIIAEVEQAWEQAGSISEKLDIFVDAAVKRHFERIRQMPDSNDLLTGCGDAGFTELQLAETRKVGMLAGLFAARREALARNGSSPTDLAEFFHNSASSFKYTAHDRVHLERLLATLKRSTMLMLGES